MSLGSVLCCAGDILNRPKTLAPSKHGKGQNVSRAQKGVLFA